MILTIILIQLGNFIIVGLNSGMDEDYHEHLDKDVEKRLRGGLRWGVELRRIELSGLGHLIFGGRARNLEGEGECRGRRI